MPTVSKPSKSKAKRTNQYGHGATKSLPAVMPPGTAAIRMYDHGLGDCFLLRFATGETGRDYAVLIDCGLIGVAKDPRPTMEKVAEDIRNTCGGHLDLAIVTHEHWDHVSGFSTQQAQAVFDRIRIDQVWYAWTENPRPENILGNRLRKEREAKAEAVHLAAIALQSIGDTRVADRGRQIGSLLSFFGYDDAREPAVAPVGTIGKTRAAFDYLARKEGVQTLRYCHPADPPVLLASGAIRAYILGPPEDEQLIKMSDPTKTGREVYDFGLARLADEQLAAALTRMVGKSDGKDEDCPFDPSFQIPLAATADSRPLQEMLSNTWDREPWRQITHDWTIMAESLALNLDRHTNNTCLALAFEIVATGQVLLFAADAQVGNWLSWQNLKWDVGENGVNRIVTGPELLTRTMFYKVGHHGSHNATLRKCGLEQMTNRDLIAFVPVNKVQAEKNRWHEMPFLPLINRLREKTGGRVIMADTTSLPDLDQVAVPLSPTERSKFARQIRRSADGDAPYWEIVFGENG